MSEQNPFAPPSELADASLAQPHTGSAVGLKMYVPNHVAVAAFIGSPIAGAWLLGSNFDALGRPAARTKALLLGFLATLTLFAVSFALPEGTPNSIVPIAYTFALRELARWQQGKDIERVLGSGGTKHSGWRVVGIALLYSRNRRRRRHRRVPRLRRGVSLASASRFTPVSRSACCRVRSGSASGLCTFRRRRTSRFRNERWIWRPRRTRTSLRRACRRRHRGARS